MSLHRTLLLAEEAAKYANDIFWGRSSNRPEDIAHSHMDKLNRRLAGENPQYVTEERAREAQPGVAETARLALWNQRVSKIKARRDDRKDAGQAYNTAAIIQDKFGNCLEHSVLACAYLRRLQVPSYIATTDFDTNHVFVVIDGLAGLDGRMVKVTKDDTAQLGTATTVICDPWWHDWYALTDWSRKMWPVFQKTKKTPGTVPSPLTLWLESEAHVS